MLIVDNSYDFGRNAEINAISDVSAMGGTPVMALGIVGPPVNVLLFVTVGAILPGGLGVGAPPALQLPATTRLARSSQLMAWW